nr:MAG TPA: Methyltransferase domain [Caudoviricetes sp.]
MHAGAFEFVGKYATTDALTVIEIGSRDINGSVRVHFPSAAWTGLDLHSGPAVDIVCDAIDYEPAQPVDLVVCCEVFEHCESWRDLIRKSFGWLKPSGRLIVTCAGDGREPHSAIDGGPLRLEEHYANISTDELAAAMQLAGFERIETASNEHWKDTYAIAVKS